MRSELARAAALRFEGAAGFSGLEPEAVHAVLADLDAWPLGPAEEGLLDAAERARAARFATPLLRRRFVVAHALLRQVLGRALGRHPAELRFEPGFHGKPRLAGAGEGLHFNLSHSGRLALLALGPFELGADLEELRPLSDRAELEERVFTAAERAAIARSPDPTRAFFEAWTRKEALIKATGQGLSAPLQEIDISREDEGGGSCVRLRGALDTRWRVVDLQPATDFAAAVALPRQSALLHLHPSPAAPSPLAPGECR